MTTNLSGSLSEFSLAEVLSLLGMGGRTARMQVTSADAVGTVHLVDGRVSSATADSARAGLLRGVVAALAVPVDDLAQSLQADDPVRALVDSGVVDREAAQQVASEACTEAVGEMLDWTSGEFAVWVGSQDPGDIGVRMDVDGLVAASRERAQEWRDLRAALPESDSVLALVADVAQAPVVDRDDWAVLARVDGRRTLAEVLAAMGASPLAAGNRLVQLMGRGLVAVQVGGGDAEQERTNQMLDAFDFGGPADDLIEVAVAPEPEFVPDVRDLFVTEPEAVEEWQVAAAESWTSAELEPVVSLGAEPTLDPAPVAVEQFAPVEQFAAVEEFAPVEQFAPASEWSALVAPELPAGHEPVGFGDLAQEGEPTGYQLEAPAYDLQPVGFAAEPVAFEAESPTYDLEPEAQESVSMTFDLEPVAEPVAESFAWSPWAQEMGLGEAPAATAAAAAPESFDGSGFADMVEDAGGHGHTDAFPVPQAPVAQAEEGYNNPLVEFPPDPTVVDEVAQFLPQPRDPGDGVGDPIAPAGATGAHAADPEHVAALETPTAAFGADTEATETPEDPAADPLAGGLLAHLMSSVRGL